MKILARKVADKWHIFKNLDRWKATTLCGKEYFYVPFAEEIDIDNPDMCKACRYRLERCIKVVSYAGLRAHLPEEELA